MTVDTIIYLVSLLPMSQLILKGFCLGFDQSMKEMAFLLWRAEVFTVKRLGVFI